MSHVQNIKKRFENLNLSSEIDSLVDIAPLRVKSGLQNNSFQRSATLFEFGSPNKSDKSNEDEDSRDENPFQRQNSDSSSSYKSLRRSQAFRLDIQRKPNLAVTKTTPTSSTTKLKRHNAIKYVSPQNKFPQFDEIQYLATSETIKKALNKPLPQGPAPKKPPRTFTSSPKTSPVEETVKLCDDLEKVTIQQNVYKSKINDARRVRTLPKASEKRSDKRGISSFLNCIIQPCSIDPIYYEQTVQERRQRIDSQSEEKIYMEPYEHLNFMKSQPEDASPKTEELHYMCTDIIDQSSNSIQPISQNDINRCSHEVTSPESSDLESYEKINILMDVVYDEKHRDTMIDESSGSSEVEGKSPVPKVTRSLTEKRKKYVRRVSEKMVRNEATQLISNISSAASIISQFQRIIDLHSPKKEVQSPSKRSDSLIFKMALLVGYDMINNKGYVKSIYPKTEKPPPMIEQFIYPNSKNATKYMTKENQNFMLILTDEYGNNEFGFCKQVMPEGFDEQCLPLTYCIISKTNASGFYFNLLREIESRHGYPDIQFSNMMRSLQSKELPASGKTLHVKLNEKMHPEKAKKPDRDSVQKVPQNRLVSKRLSLESPEWLKSAETSPIVRSNTDSVKRTDEILIKRASDVRFQNDELTVLHESTTKELLVAIFGTLLIERKVVLLGSNITQITSCVTALYSILYPFQWHHIIIALIPDETVTLIEAPMPYLIGVLKDSIAGMDFEVEDGIIVDLDTKTLIKKCGDESTLVPETLKKSMLMSLQIVEAVEKKDKLKNVLIADTFLKFFIRLFSKLDSRTYCKHKFIESHEDQAIRYFLEWFLETVMYKEFLSKKQSDDNQRESNSGQQPSENYFGLYNIKLLEKSATLSDSQQKKNIERLIKSSRQKKRNFKDKIKDFLKS